jgi:glycosyltransferase involved in cell wall biosynthesis
MKTLIISALYHPNQVGGAEKVAQFVAEGMVRTGHECVVVTTMEKPGVSVSQLNGVKVYYIGLKNLYWPHSRKERWGISKPLWHALDRYNPFMARAVARVLDAEKPEVVHSHSLTGFSCAVWDAVKSRRLPLVHTLHDYSLMCPKTSMFSDSRNCDGQCKVCAGYTAPARRVSNRVDAVVGVSRFTLERHLACGYFEQVRERLVIYNALPGRVAAGSRHQGAERPLRLGYVGQLVPTKGIGQLVTQMRGWASSQCELLVAGKGAAAYERALREEAPPNVRFLGFVDPDDVYASIDVLVVPSLWEEPLGMIVLEAYMHGIPVIAARRGGLPEIVEDGQTGRIYEPLEPHTLRDAIEGLVRDRGQLARMRARVLEKAPSFLLDRMQKEYVDLVARVKNAARPD